MQQCKCSHCQRNPDYHEARVASGFIDGRDKEIIHDPETGKYTVNKVFWKTEFMSRAYPSPLASLTTCGS